MFNVSVCFASTIASTTCVVKNSIKIISSDKVSILILFLISSVKVTLSSAANPNSTSQSFNCTSISKWRSLVLWSNFFPVVRYYEYGVTHAPSNTTINYSYNSSNGILTVTSSHSDIVFHYGTSSATCYCDAYYF